MKQVLLLICLYMSLSMQARSSKDTAAPRFLCGVSAFYSVPLGPFSWKQGRQFLTGTSMPTMSGEVDVLHFRFYRGLWIGFSAGAIAHNINADALAAQLYSRYSAPGYYTTATVNSTFFDIGWLAAKISYAWRIRGFEAQPYLFLGYAAPNAYALENNYSIYRKRKEENYSETISDSVATGSFFYPGIGININKKLWRGLWATAGARYCNGKIKYTLTEHKIDYLGNTSTGPSENFVQPVPVLQFHGGLQLRFGRRPSYNYWPFRHRWATSSKNILHVTERNDKFAAH